MRTDTCVFECMNVYIGVRVNFSAKHAFWVRGEVVWAGASNSG